VFTPGSALRHIVAQVGASQLMLGTDHPIPWEEHPVDKIFETKTLSDKEKIAILGGNAARLFGFEARVFALSGSRRITLFNLPHHETKMRWYKEGRTIAPGVTAAALDHRSPAFKATSAVSSISVISPSSTRQKSSVRVFCM